MVANSAPPIAERGRFDDADDTQAAEDRRADRKAAEMVAGKLHAPVSDRLPSGDLASSPDPPHAEPRTGSGRPSLPPTFAPSVNPLPYLARFLFRIPSLYLGWT